MLAHGYHAAQFALHILLHPIWRAPGAALLVALAGRVAGFARTPRRTAILACLSAGAGWLVLDPSLAWPPAPLARLPGLALILALGTTTQGRPALPLTCLLASWWLRGAPISGPAILNCMPVFVGLWASIPIARRLARRDKGWSALAAALALSGSLLVTGAATHWSQAAIVAAMAALALINTPDAGRALAAPLMVVAAAAIVASDRGRLIPVDAAGLAPLLAWILTPRLTRGVAQHETAFAGLLAVILCIALSYAAARILTV